MPEATFDKKSWFEVAFPKPQFNWYEYNESYENDIKMWKLNEEKYLKHNNYDIMYLENGKRTLKIRPLYETGIWLYEDYISRGEWDNPKFTENERILAWRIECNKIN